MMINFFKVFFTFIISVMLWSNTFADSLNIPILCYHNFNPTKPGSMNLTPERLESQIKWLKDNGFTIIPLKDAVAYIQGTLNTLPPKPVVITADDGWKSVYTYMLPIVRKYNIPVTLFIYPSTISEGKNAMTWDDLKTLQATGLFDIQSHTYTHPNFKHAKKDLGAEKFQNFVKLELQKSKQILEEKLNKKISFVAWPFGIYDSYLEGEAAKAGYTMAFTIDAKMANKNFRPMAEPRYMIVEGLSMNTFKNILNQANHS